MELCGTDIDEKNNKIAAIIEQNPQLVDAISLQQQTESRFIFKNNYSRRSIYFYYLQSTISQIIGEATKAHSKVSNLESKNS
jgi:23S rRNA (adenine1618-N6)-methyltransferase